MSNEFPKQIEKFLRAVEKDFPVPLSQKVNIEEYSRKLYDRAAVVYERKDDKIVAMVAGYVENLSDGIAYIAIVSTLKEYRGKGLARKLLFDFINLCEKKQIKAVHLYTDQCNQKAIKLYESLGFVDYKIVNEPRPQDKHLIFYL